MYHGEPATRKNSGHDLYVRLIGSRIDRNLRGSGYTTLDPWKLGRLGHWLGALMIDNENHPVAWALLIAELDEAREHMESLINEMQTNGKCDEESYRVQLGHVFAHLNRAWNGRDKATELSDDEWTVYSQYPKDLEPVG